MQLRSAREVAISRLPRIREILPFRLSFHHWTAKTARPRLPPQELDVNRSHSANDQPRQVAATSFVRYRWSTTVSRRLIRTPPRCINSPVHAIIAPLSMHNSPGGPN